MSKTLSTLELSLAAYTEIIDKLSAAGDGSRCMEDGRIDMSGIAIAVDKEGREDMAAAIESVMGEKDTTELSVEDRTKIANAFADIRLKKIEEP